MSTTPKNTSVLRHIIIGTGPAGVTAAETIREHAPQDRITLIGNEPGLPYARMAIPYLLSGKIEERGTRLRASKSHYHNRDIRLVQERVTRIAPESSRLVLTGGATVEYDRLLIACGAHPVSPPVPGIELEAVIPCWTLGHARRIARRARAGTRVVLIGAGFIGCIILEALVRRGVRLTVVETGDRMVPRMLNHTAGGLLEDWCRTKGVTVYTSNAVQAIDENRDGSLALTLSNSRRLDADLVITATGVRPNTGFLQDSGIEVDGGVLVDQYLRSNVPNVYAAGDVAKGRDFSTGSRSVQAIQPTAVEHGRIAAMNMIGQPVMHQGSLAMNVLDTLGLVSSSFGRWMGVDGGDGVDLLNPRRYRYLDLRFQDDILIGATALGLTEQVGILHGLIKGRIRLGRWKQRLLQDPTLVTEAYIASTRIL